MVSQFCTKEEKNCHHEAWLGLRLARFLSYPYNPAVFSEKHDRVNRRRLLAVMAGASTALLPLASKGEERFASHEWMDLRLPGSAQLARRATVFTPKESRGTPLPVLVLLHGLGETGNDRDGAYAWVERYGLLSSYERLWQPPVERTLSRQRFLVPERSRAINRELSLHPFRGMVLVCPYTPNVFRMNTSQALDDYADWIVQVLLPEVRSRTPVRSEMRWTGIDGCSLGGFISYQVFFRKPEAFYSCGAVQAAFGKGAASSYADTFKEIVERHGLRRIHIETSTSDPYHDANVLLSQQLSRRGIEHQLRVPPGPHNQPWLIEAGTLEMLLWHDRQLWASNR